MPFKRKFNECFSDRFDNGTDALSAAAADRFESVAHLAASHLMQQ